MRAGKVNQAMAAPLQVFAVAASRERKIVFIVTTRLGMPFCFNSPKKPATSMLPNGEEGEPAEETLELGVGVDGVHDPWALNCLNMADSSPEKWASDNERGRCVREKEGVRR